mmetsp:Transcript_13459/g.28465  ORF Transcript_13459/g.28465 Transcript_13459/m.28465 type:complete len:100 (+) Transcript_13459:1830-2129(+)
MEIIIIIDKGVQGMQIDLITFTMITFVKIKFITGKKNLWARIVIISTVKTRILADGNEVSAILIFLFLHAKVLDGVTTFLKEQMQSTITASFSYILTTF